MNHTVTVCIVCGLRTYDAPQRWDSVVKNGVTLLIPCHTQEQP